jgi:hypothetical protein
MAPTGAGLLAAAEASRPIPRPPVRVLPDPSQARNTTASHAVARPLHLCRMPVAPDSNGDSNSSNQRLPAAITDSAQRSRDQRHLGIRHA